MECNKHKNRIVMHAFSNGNCIICGINIVTGHIPCNKVCVDCSVEKNLCEICGDPIKSDNKKDGFGG